MMIGRIHEVDGHFVATRFMGLLVPTESVYVTHHAGRSTNGETSDGLRIPIDWQSVAIGCGRVWLPALAVALPITLGLLGRLHVAAFVASAIFIGLSVIAHRAGRLSDETKARLRLLGSVTGLRIEPSKLRPDTRAVKRDSLGELMEKGGIPLTPEGILSILEEIPIPALPLVYGYGRYAGDEPAWQECAEIVYQRHQQSEM